MHAKVKRSRPPRECKKCGTKYRKSKELRFHNEHNHGTNVEIFRCMSDNKWHEHYSEVAYRICSGHEDYDESVEAEV